MEPNYLKMIPLIKDFSLFSLIRKPTCYRTKNARFIDVILKHKEHLVLMNRSFEAGYSDHHYITYTMLDFVPPSHLVCIHVFESLKERSRECGESCQ